MRVEYPYAAWNSTLVADSSPHARGILATLIILARNSFEYNVIGFWVIIHISVYLASTFLVFLNRRKNTVFALLAIFGVVAPYFAIITAEILFLHRRPPLFLAISNFKVNVYLAWICIFFNLRYQKHRPAFKIISASSLKVLWPDSPSQFEPLPFPNAENGVHSRIRGKIPWETGMAGWVLRFIPACAGKYICPAFSTGRNVGSSPHARGIHCCQYQFWFYRRFIPACAGNTSTVSGLMDSP